MNANTIRLTRSSIARLVATLGAFALLLAFQSPAAAGVEKVTLCHFPPGNPDNVQTITVGEPSLSAHLAHGDPVGTCEELFPELFGDGGVDTDPPADDDSGTASDDDTTSDDDSGTASDDGSDPVEPADNMLDDPNTREGTCSFLLEESYDGKAGFYVLSSGNLDSDSSLAYFYRGGHLNAACEIEGQPRVISENSLE